jgi:hypothetical protein
MGEYLISRGTGNMLSGQIYVVSDGTSVNLVETTGALLGSVGVTITASITTGTVSLQYTSTNTGTQPLYMASFRKFGAF